MIVGELKELDFDPALIEMTDWQISDKPDFTSIVAESLNDTVNKTTIILDQVSVKVGKQYYGRARVLLKDMGWNTINTMDIFVREPDDDVVAKNSLPTMIPAPRIKVQVDGESVPLDQVPNNSFNIVLEPQDLVGDNFIEVYLFNYYILDSKGHVIFKLEETTKRTIGIEEGLIQPHQTYTIKCCCMSNVAEVSPLATVVISTIPAFSDESIVSIIRGFVGRDYTQEIAIRLPFDLDFQTQTVEIILSRNGISTTVWTQHIIPDDPYLRVPANTMVAGKFYIAKVTRGENSVKGNFQAL